jgi:esterase/lipase
VIGFSTGGALTLLHASLAPPDLAGIVAIAPPIKFRSRSMRFVPLVHGANQVVEWVSRQDGILPFRRTETEHPDINYRHMPIRGLYELTRMVAAVKKALPAISCPSLLIQGTEDHVVEPRGAVLVIDSIGSMDKRLAWVESARHGILYENVGETHQLVFDFLARLSAQTAALQLNPNAA